MEDRIDENTLVGELSVEQFLKILREGIQEGSKHIDVAELEGFFTAGSTSALFKHPPTLHSSSSSRVIWVQEEFRAF
ncbi:UNVERIFIED_CONTAM: hypothetical protein K2H54_048570 [Gekko kuhli]